MKFKNLLGNSLLITLVLLCAFILYKVYNNENIKTGYVDLNRVLSDFDLKKELEKDLNSITEKRKTLIDSLEFELRVLSKQLTQDKDPDKNKVSFFDVKKEEYYEKKKQFEEDNTRIANQYDEQIFIQLNQYVKDYGAQNGYTYILGADGSGVLMYSDEGRNITKEVTDYINERYKGNTK